MSGALELLSGTWCQYGVRAMLHSLWQATAIAAVLWVLLRVMPPARCRVRYGLSAGALVLSLLCIPATMSVLAMPAPQSRHVEAASVVGPVAEAPAGGMQARASGAPEPALPPFNAVSWVGVAAVVWAVGFGLMLVRLCLQVRGAARLAARGRAATSEELLQRLERLRQKLRLKRSVRLLLVEDLLTPAVIGVLRPVVVVPVAIVSSLPAEQLEAVLLHELAHIRRSDYLVNLLQMLIEAILFFNPAVWWISGRVRVEREASCDAVAARVMGQAVTFAQALAAVVSLMGGRESSPGVAFADGASPLERVKRLLVPTYRPGLRLGGRAMAGVLASGLVLMAGLWGTTQAVVAVAAEALSPQQRVDRIETLQKSHGEGAQDVPAGMLNISGEVVTEDGQLLPKRLWLQVRTEQRQRSIVSQLPVNDGVFESGVDSGAIVLIAEMPGYTPCALGRFVGKPGENVTDLRIVLRRGWAGRVQVRNAAGNAMADQELSVSKKVTDDYSTTPVRLRTDSAGQLTIPACDERPVTIAGAAPGYQFDQMTVTLPKDAPVKWVLQKAKPQAGRVVAEADGEAVPEARVLMLCRTGFAAAQYHPREGAPLLAQSDKEGRFVLDTLREDCTYTLCFIAKGFTPQMLYDVRVTDKPLEVKLKPGIHVRGRVLAPAATLRKLLRVDGGKFKLDYCDTISISRSSSYSTGGEAPVSVKDDEARFELADVFPGELRFQLGEGWKRVVVERNMDDLVFDLRQGRKDAVPAKSRRVEIRLIPPRGSPLPKGSLQVTRTDPAHSENYREQVEIPLNEGVAVFDTVPGINIGYANGAGLAGYSVEEKSEVEVPAGNSPLVVEAPVKPSGAVYGVVKAADGQPLGEFYASVVLLEGPKDHDNEIVRAPQGVNVHDSSGKYLLSPLPLGGKYCVVVSSYSSAACALSEPFVVTAEHPVIEISPRMVAGVSLRGQILDPEGRPVPLAVVSLQYTLRTASSSYSTASRDATSDREGRFVFTAVNPAFGGKLMLRAEPARDYQNWAGEGQADGKEQVIRLPKGKSFRGQLLDNKTGKPVEDAVVRVGTNFLDTPTWLETRTDAQGHFAFTTLSDLEYQMYIGNCYPAGTVITPLPGPRGGYSISGSSSFPAIRPEDGPEQVFRVEVVPK